MSIAMVPNLHLGMLGRRCDRVTRELPSPKELAASIYLQVCWIYKVTGIGVPLEHLKIVAFVCPSLHEGDNGCLLIHTYYVE